MRLVVPLAAAVLLSFASGAAAEPVSVAPVEYSPEFAQQLDEELGPREGEMLSAVVAEAVGNALQRRGASLADGALVSIEVSIVDAAPNRPTMQQMSDRPGLDPIRSISIGGAELHAVVRDEDGGAAEVTHRRYNSSIEEVSRTAATTWGEARRAIRQFAEKVADAYEEQAGR